jgi:Skp family chaperone for outer membrane proteins
MFNRLALIFLLILSGNMALADTTPPGTVITYINLERIFANWSITQSKATRLSEIHQVTSVIAAKKNIGLVLDRVVWVSPNLDLTPYVLAALRGEQKGLQSGQEFPRQNIKVKVVNVHRIFSGTKLGRKIGTTTLAEAQAGDKTQFITTANIAIKQTAEKQGLDLVLQNHFWSSPDLDMSDMLIEVMDR